MTKLILIFSTFLILVSSQNSENNNNVSRTLNYYLDGKIYSIEEKNNYFNIVIKEQVVCVMEPCIPPIIDTMSINKEEDCKALKLLFEEIFKNSNLKEKSIYDGELLTNEQIDIIFKILENNNIISKLEYKIINNLSSYNQKYSQKGFSYETENDSVIYTVAMGEKTTGGYSIDVKKVKIKGNSAIIYVREKIPGENEVVTDAFTYPIVQVKFNKFPTKITVLNYDTNETYSLIYL